MITIVMIITTTTTITIITIITIIIIIIIINFITLFPNDPKVIITDTTQLKEILSECQESLGLGQTSNLSRT